MAQLLELSLELFESSDFVWDFGCVHVRQPVEFSHQALTRQVVAQQRNCKLQTRFAKFLDGLLFKKCNALI